MTPLGVQRSSHFQPNRSVTLAAGAVMAGAAIALFITEKRRPLRQQRQAEPARTIRNLVMGAGSIAVVNLLQRPLVDPLSARVREERWGIAQQVKGPEWLRDAVAFLLLDYTTYVWHVLTHKVPFLWRFHLVHHIDLDLDTSSALRFHVADMAISVPWRAGQVAVCGASPRALLLWQTFFFVSVVFHHSNVRLPLRFERRLVRVLTTPRLHGIHHSMVREETDSNWSSGISLWDWLHGTIKLDVEQESIAVGVPAYADPAATDLAPSLLLPFRKQREDWAPSSGSTRRFRRPQRSGPA